MKKHAHISWWLGGLLLAAITLLLLGAYLTRETQITGGTIGAPLDDAWIHFQFARNLREGQGFSYNPGQPTPGSTAPLWTVMLAAGAFVTQEYLVLSLVLSAVFLVATVLATYGFAGWVSDSLWTALLAGVGVALAGRLLWAGLAGMETTAFALLSLAAIWSYSRRGLGLLPALFFGLASQLRPEGHALFALAVADFAYQWFRIERQEETFSLGRAARAFLPPLLIYLVLSLPYSLFSLATTGRPLPNTFYAKTGSLTFFSWRTLRETLVYHWQDNAVALLLALFGLVPLWRRSRLAVMWLLALPLLTAVIIDFTWHHGRYTMPLIPLQMTAAAVGAQWLINKLPEKTSGSLPWRTIGWAAVLLLLILGGAWRLNHWATMLGTNTKEIEEIDIALGRWLADNTPSEALIAVDDIGAVTFISGRRIVDMNGLVSPEVWPALEASEGLERDQVLARILSEAEPAFMAAFPLWRWNIATNPDVANEVHHVRTETDTIIFQQDAYVYETTWPYRNAVEPDVLSTAVFGDAIGLAGYDLQVSDRLDLVFYWQSLAPVLEDYDVFLHLLDQDGVLIAQSDRQPLSGLAATSAWETGDIIRDPRKLELPESLEPGEYQLLVGLYLRENGRRLAVTGAPAADNALPLSAVSLP